MDASRPSSSSLPRLATTLVAGLLATITLAALYEALFALRVITVPAGATSGTTPAFETPLLDIAIITMTAASVGFLLAIGWTRLRDALGSVSFLWILPLACASLVVARNYTFDPYYLPDLIRASTNDGDLIYWWVPVGIVAAVLTNRLASKTPRLVMLINAAVLFMAAIVTLVITGFH